MIVWPFYPDWGRPYVERLSYLTEIIPSHSGKEQRRALRKAARRTIEYRLLAPHERLQTFRALLNRRDEDIVFPDEVRRVSPSVAAAPGSTSVTFGSVPWWVTPGQDLVFEVADTRQRTVRTVAGVAGNVVTFDDAAVSGWGVRTRIMPALRGRLASTIRSRALTNEITQADVDLEVEPGTEIENAGAAVTTFNGREVMTLRPNWSDTPQIEVVDPTEWVDNDMGVRTAYRPVAFNTEIREATYLLRDADDVDAIVGAFHRAKGRRGEFYQASGLNDFSLMQTVGSGAYVWRVAGHDFHAAYDGDTVHRAFEILLRSGAVLRFRVVDITTGGTTDPYSLIETIEVAPYAIAPEDVLMISWLPVVRFASDELTITWRTDRIAEVVVNTQTLEDL